MKEIYIGDSKFSSEKLAEPVEEEKLKIEASKERWGVLDDASERFAKTLETNNYKFVAELPNGMKYPTVEDWVRSRGLDSKHIRFYPAFIENTETKALLFCKAKIASKLDYNAGLKTEADILSLLPSDITTPKLIKYFPENKESGQLELLVLEAVKWSEAQVVPVGEWKPEYIEDVRLQIEHVGKIPLTSMPSVSQTPQKNIQRLFDQAGEQMTEAFESRARIILQNPEMDFAPVFVHSDMWIKNILISTDISKPKTMLVDWALAGAGYKGEDLARLWWDLWRNENLRPLYREIKDKETIFRKSILKLGLLYVALRDIVEYVEHIPTLVEPKLSQILAKIKEIQKQALVMLEYLD